MSTGDKNDIAVDVFNKRAGNYQAKFMDTSLYHDTFNIFCDSIAKVNAQVLELACGPGNVTQYLLSKRHDLNILATDLAPNMLEIAKENNPTATFQMLDCRAILSLNKKFDGIVCAFGLPYLSKEEAIQLIADAAKALVDGGVMYLSCIEDDYNASGWQTSSAGDKIYLYYHQEDYLTEALDVNAFSIIAIQRKHYDYNDATINDLIIVAKR